MQCVLLSTPKKAAQHTALFACDGVHQCVMLCGGWWMSVNVCCGVWCGGCCGKKGKRQTHSQTKTKRTFPKTTFSLFPFFHLFFFHSFLLAFHSSTITPFLSIHSPVFHASHMSAFVEPKTPTTQHLILFIVLSFCPNSLFLFFSICR